MRSAHVCYHLAITNVREIVPLKDAWSNKFIICIKRYGKVKFSLVLTN
jgi:hypothetical protein